MIIDNVLPDKVFQSLQKEIFSREFPWFYGAKVDENTEPSSPFSYGWSHGILSNFGKKSSSYNFVFPLITDVITKTGHDLSNVIQIRIKLNTIADNHYVQQAHVDQVFPHWTGLLYMNDSDGNTIVYNERYDRASELHPFEYAKNTFNDQFTIKETVEPKANRLLIFDGLQYHSGTTPISTSRRVIINFNYVANQT